MAQLDLEKEIKFDASAFRQFVRSIATRLRNEFGGSKSDREIDDDIEKVIAFTENLDAGGIVEDNANYDNLSTFVTIQALQNWTDTFFKKQELQVNSRKKIRFKNPLVRNKILVGLAGIFQQYFQFIWCASEQRNENHAKRQYRFNLWGAESGAPNRSVDCQKFCYCPRFDVRRPGQR